MPLDSRTVQSTVICELGDLADPGSRAFSIGEGDWPLRGFIVRKADEVFAYVNHCPHAGHPLNWQPDDFLTPDRSLIMCRSHGAMFEINSGQCVAGPCAGRALRSLRARVENGQVIVDVDAGTV
jgi:nitrite reductase/ring-hydroxylating ferredoxin subunit